MEQLSGQGAGDAAVEEQPAQAATARRTAMQELSKVYVEQHGKEPSAEQLVRALASNVHPSLRAPSRWANEHPRSPFDSL